MVWDEFALLEKPGARIPPSRTNSGLSDTWITTLAKNQDFRLKPGEANDVAVDDDDDDDDGCRRSTGSDLSTWSSGTPAAVFARTLPTERFS